MITNISKNTFGSGKEQKIIINSSCQKSKKLVNEKKFQKFKNMNRLIFEPNGWQNTLADGEERYSYQDNIRMDDGDQKVSINPVIRFIVYTSHNLKRLNLICDNFLSDQLYQWNNGCNFSSSDLDK